MGQQLNAAKKDGGSMPPMDLEDLVKQAEAFIGERVRYCADKRYRGPSSDALLVAAALLEVRDALKGMNLEQTNVPSGADPADMRIEATNSGMEFKNHS